MFTREEVNGLLVILMRIDQNIRRRRTTLSTGRQVRRPTRELEALFDRMRERHRRMDEREARRRERLRRLTFGLLGRQPDTA